MWLFVTSALLCVAFLFCHHPWAINCSFTHWPAVSSQESSLWFKFLETLVEATVFAPCKGIQDRLGFWILDSGLDSTPWIPDSRYWISDSLSVELGSRKSIVSGIPDSLSCILDPKAQDSKLRRQIFPSFRNPYSITWGNVSSIAS